MIKAPEACLYLPVKTYLKQWLLKVYGVSFTADLSTPLGAMVTLLLYQLEDFPPATLGALKPGNSYYEMQVPGLPENFAGRAIPAQLADVLYCFLEELFKLELYYWCRDRVAANPGRYKGYDQALEAFADFYEIEIPEMISFDGLKRKELRFRVAFEQDKTLPVVACPFPRRVARPILKHNAGKPFSVQSSGLDAARGEGPAPGPLQLVLL